MANPSGPAGETAPLQALSERWRGLAELSSIRIKADTLRSCANELDAALSRLSVPQGETTLREQVERFRHWVNTTPNSALTGNSRVAFDAQVRVLRQLFEYLDEPTNGYLRSCVNHAWETRTGDPHVQ